MHLGALHGWNKPLGLIMELMLRGAWALENRVRLRRGLFLMGFEYRVRHLV